MEFLPEALEEYVCAHTEEESPILARLNTETWQKVIYPRMLAGHLQGRVLSMLSHMIAPRVVVELGTYTGYSAMCWAEGLQQGGTVHTIDINEEFADIAARFWNEAELTDRITQHIGSGLDIIPTLTEPIDLLFLDADKENYANYYDLAFDKVRTGGYIIADNVLWSGKILNEPASMDKDTRALYEFNKKVQADDRVQNVLFPVRDGLMICRKK